MEEVHGVDVSWIHHSHNDRLYPAKSAPAVPTKESDAEAGKKKTKENVKPITTNKNTQAQQGAAGVKNAIQIDTSSVTVPSTPPQAIISSPPAQPSKLPGLLRRSSREKVNNNNVEGPRNSMPRRSSASSWISSISSKLSTSPHPGSGPNTPVSASSHSDASLPSPISNTSGAGNALTRASTEDTRPYVPQQPKSGGTSFISNALRRLSTTAQLGRTGANANGTGLSPRRVLNVDPNRQRCLLPELEQKKLKRVAFCVDVEIAGGPRYMSDENKDEKREKDAVRKSKDKAEGEALKHPKEVEAVKNEAEAGKESGVALDVAPPVPAKEGDSDEAPPPPPPKDKKDISRKKEKKKRSEEERKERKEQKRRKAEENGSIPMQITRQDSSASSAADAAAAAAAPGTAAVPGPRPLDRPTTDPLRVYRRCCQLRETPILKRITDQLSSTTISSLSTPGVVTVLDLTGSRLQLADVITLSDWLAIVPVRKLYLDDADLNDEGLRVVLAGLLAATSPDFSKRQRPLLADKHEERSGIVEKLSLKSNPKLTKEGWKHLSLFVYMCRSLRALDVSVNAFPPSPPKGEQIDVTCGTRDIVEVFAKAISERLAGNFLEELIMGECSLTAHHIRKITDAASVCGVSRLGLAGNNIDAEGLGYIIHYLRSGVCEGIDLGSNDLRDHLDVIGEAFDGNTPIWALSLANCNLDPTSLKPLFPGLLNLQNLRFLDVSHNPELFTAKTSALGILRKYLPMMRELRRIHLNHVDMTPWQAISMADIIGECPVLAHIALLGNPQITELADARGEEEQEEACALYASLMAAARVSHSLISIEVDVPTAENSEIVRALAKQSVAYCLRNMEAFYPAVATPDSASGSGAGPSREPLTELRDVEVPEVLLHLVGHAHKHSKLEEPEDDAELAPDMDYIVGGTGVVKALNYCLNGLKNGNNAGSLPQSGAASPRGGTASATGESAGVRANRAKNMSKNLLESARRIRERLQPALVREWKGDDDWAFRRLMFLDDTLRGIIERFESEFPETRVPDSTSQATGLPTTTSFGLPGPGVMSTLSGMGMATGGHDAASSPEGGAAAAAPGATATTTTTTAAAASQAGRESDSEDEDDMFSEARMLRRSSRQMSDVELAAKALGREEGQVHKLGQQAKRRVLGDVKGDVSHHHLGHGPGHEHHLHEHQVDGHPSQSAVASESAVVADDTSEEGSVEGVVMGATDAREQGIAKKIEQEHIRALREKLSLLSASSSSASEATMTTTTSNSTTTAAAEHV